MVQVGGGQDLVELGLLLLQAEGQRSQLPLQEKVLEAALLLHLQDGLGELLVQIVPLHLNLRRGTGGGQMAERLGSRAINQKVASLIPGSEKMTLCPWARHFTLLASGGLSLYLL